MEFIRNILIIDKSVETNSLIKNHILGSSNKVQVFCLNSRAKLTETSNQHNFKCVYLNSNIGKQDIFYILRFFSMLNKKNNSEIPIFFTSDDFDLLQEILVEFPLKELKILNTPLDIDDLVNKIQIATFGKAVIQKTKSSLNNLEVDLEFINVFIQNTKKIITSMAQIPDLINSPPMLMTQLKEPLDIAISAKILISSVYFKGSYYISFPKSTFLNFYEKVVMERCDEITNENKDFASELANIIYGQCKQKFSNDGYNLDMVIPSLHMGEINYSVVIVIPFECSLGKFYLAVAPGLI